MKAHEPIVQLAYRLKLAAEVIDVSPRYLWDRINAGEIGVVRLGEGRRPLVLIPRQELERFLAERTERRGKEGGQ